MPSNATRSTRAKHDAQAATRPRDEDKPQLVSRVGALEIDWPRSLGFFGGIVAAVGAGLIEPPLGASLLLAGQLTGREPPWSGLYSPGRTDPGSPPTVRSSTGPRISRCPAYRICRPQAGRFRSVTAPAPYPPSDGAA